MRSLSNYLTLLALLFSASLNASADELELTLLPENELNRIDEKVYSHFLEHIYHSVNGGLWGELVWNRSFEDNSQSGWSRKNDVIVQNSLDADRRFLFGDADWADYEFTLEARKTEGEEGFLVLFRTKNDKEFSWVNLGGWQNKRHGIERRSAAQNRQGGVGKIEDGSIETGKWYTIKVRCEGENVKVWLDDEQLLDVTDPDMAKSGRVGIGTWATQAEFRNAKVVSLDGKTVLLDKMSDVFEAVKIRHWEIGPEISLFPAVKPLVPLNGKFSLAVETGKNDTEISQKGFVLRKGEVYEISLWSCPMQSAPAKIDVSFDNLPATPAADTPVRKDAWTQRNWTFKPDRDIDDATFRVHFPKGVVCLIDQVSVMPKSWKENGGFRPDLLDAIAEIKAPLIRWPGGCFASAYRWKDGIGPQENRQPYPFTIWDDREVNSYGTDEFIAMCRRVGCEPMIVINAGTPGWNAKRTPECKDVDWVQEACDWIEYCNGPVTSKWGKIRAENGYPEPYDVKYWEIDNETQGGVTVEQYIEIIRKFAPAMKKIDPSIKLAVAGSHYGPREPWDFPIVNETGSLFDYLSFHQYDDPNQFAEGPGRIENYFRKLQQEIAKSPNKNIRIFDSEWNAQSTDWRTGLYCGGILNVFERCGDIVEIAAPALFLRHHTATAWDNAFVNFDNKSWYPAPNYVVMKLWREHYAPIRIGLDGDSKSLNVVATKSEDGKTLYFKAVNPQNEPCTVTLKFDGKHETASFRFVAANRLNDRNTLETPNAIASKDGDAVLDGQTVRVVLPPYSAGVVTLR